MSSRGLVGLSALATDSFVVESAAEPMQDGQSRESGGVVIHVVIEPLARCVSSCADQLPATGGVLPSAAWWIAVALLAAGLAFVLRSRRTSSGGNAWRPWERSYPYDVVSGRRAGSARVELHLPAITHAPPAGTDRDGERGDP